MDGVRVGKTYLKKSWLKLPKFKDIQIQEAKRTPTRVNPKRPTLRHIVIRLSKSKSKVVRE